MPTYSTLNHALQFGTNTPTVSIYGTDVSGYIFYQMGGSFYTFEPGTKYFAIQIIFNTPYATVPVSVSLTPANSFTQQALASTQAIGFYVDGGTAPGDVSSDLQTTYFNISGISTTETILGTGVLAWYYEVSTGSLVAGSTGTVTSVATNATLTGGPILDSGTLGINLTNANTWTAKQTFNNHAAIDGYTIDLSAGATTDQVLQYNGTNFIAANKSIFIGETVTSGATNNVLFVNSSGNLAQDSGFTFDGSSLTVPVVHSTVDVSAPTLFTPFIDSLTTIGIGTTGSSAISVSIGRTGVNTNINGNIFLDGYRFDLTGNVYDGYTISYQTSSGKFITTSNIIYWDGYVTWDQVYQRLVNSIIDYTTTPIVLVDGSFTQEIPAGTYDANAISNAFFFSPDYARVVVDSGVTFSGGFLYLSLHGVSFSATGPLTSSGTGVTVVLQGYGHLSNNHVSNALFPQVPDGAELAIRNTSLDSRPSATDFSSISTAGGVIFDMASAANLKIDIIGAPGGLTGTNPNTAVIGGAGTVTVKGDGMSIYPIDSTNLTGTTTFTSGYPLAYNQKLRVDNYKFDLTGGVSSNQVLQYNGTAFVAGTVATLNTAQTFTKSQNVSAYALTDAATIATDASQSNVFTITLTATGHTLGNPTNLVSGGTYLWIIRQGTGSHALLFDTLFKFPGGTAPTLTSAASAVDMISAVYDGTQLNCVFQADFK